VKSVAIAFWLLNQPKAEKQSSATDFTDYTVKQNGAISEHEVLQLQTKTIKIASIKTLRIKGLESCDKIAIKSRFKALSPHI
jgi:hypothetical protein